MEQVNIGFILLNIGYAIHHGDWNYQRISSPFARIYLVKEGTAKLHLPDKVQILLPNHLYIIPPFTFHSYECNGHFSLYYIHIYEPQQVVKRILEDFIYPTEIDASASDTYLVERLMEINPERQLKGYNPSDYDNPQTLMQSIRRNLLLQPSETFETQGILLQILSRFLKHAQHMYEITDTRIWKSIRYIRKNMDKEISLDTLAQISCLSKDHYIRLFKKEMKMTPVKYINQKKIEKAQIMLFSGNLSIKDIAYALSFNNVSYFNRVFKSFVGCTPLEYKNEQSTLNTKMQKNSVGN